MGDHFSLAIARAEPTPLTTFQPDPEKGRVENMYGEILSYLTIFQEFDKMDMVDVFQTLSQASARASEIRQMMLKVGSQRANSFRTKHIDPFIEECDRQFKTQSRIVAIQEIDAKLSGGRFT